MASVPYDDMASNTDGDFSWEETSAHDIVTPSKSTESMAQQCMLFEILVNFVLNGTMCFAGIVGNAMTCIIMWPERKKSATAFLLICLAINDSLVVVVWTTMRALQTVANLLPDSNVMYYRAYIFLYGWATGSLVHLSDSLIIIVITLQRYISVCHPHKAKNINKVSVMMKLVISIFIFTFIFTLPRYTDSRVYFDAENEKFVSLDEPWNNKTFNIVYTLILYYISIYISPLLFLIYATTRLIFSLHRNRRRRQEMTVHSRRQEDLTLSLVAVVIIFLICQLMNPLRRLMAEVIPRTEATCGYAFFYFNFISSTFVIFNSFVNFIVYCICSRQFRKKMQNLICSLQCKIPPDNFETSESLSERNKPKSTPMSTNVTRVKQISFAIPRNKVVPIDETEKSTGVVAFVRNTKDDENEEIIRHHQNRAKQETSL